MPSKSANNTPKKGAVAGPLDAIATPTRKVPHCHTCGRPRAGHPRSGCPYSPISNSPDDGDNDGAGDGAGDDGDHHSGGDIDENRSDSNLVKALGSMYIAKDPETQTQITNETPARRKGRRSLGSVAPSTPLQLEDTNKAKRERRKSERQAAAALVPSESLDSLPNSDLALLLRPNGQDILDDREDAEVKEPADAGRQKVVHWQEGISSATGSGSGATPKGKRSGKAVMPGTLTTPSPWSSLATIGGGGDFKPEITNPNSNSNSNSSNPPTRSASITSIESTDTVSIEVVSPTAPVGRPLARTMSEDERAGFMDHLEDLSTAKAYMLTRADLVEVLARKPKGLYTKVLKDNDGSDDGKNLLIVGRDSEETETLYKKLNAEKQAARQMKAAAGGAVVGAVAAYTGLAFS